MKIKEIKEILVTDELSVNDFCSEFFTVRLVEYKDDVEKLLNHYYSLDEDLKLYFVKNDREGKFAFEKAECTDVFVNRIADMKKAILGDLEENFSGRTVLKCEVNYVYEMRNIAEEIFEDDRKGFVISAYQYSYFKTLMLNLGYSFMCAVMHEDEENDRLHYHYLFVSNEESESEQYARHMARLKEDYLDVEKNLRGEEESGNSDVNESDEKETDEEDVEKSENDEKEPLEETEGEDISDNEDVSAESNEDVKTVKSESDEEETDEEDAEKFENDEKESLEETEGEDVSDNEDVSAESDEVGKVIDEYVKKKESESDEQDDDFVDMEDSDDYDDDDDDEYSRGSETLDGL